MADEAKKLQDEAKSRLNDCREQKHEWHADLREALFFSDPHNVREVENTTSYNTKPHDAEQLNSPFAHEMASDFATVMMNTFLPEAEQWASRKPGMVIPDEQKDEVQRKVRADDDKIFEAISGSNFYPECAKTFYPNLSIGVVGMWIDDPGRGQPIKCSGIPIHEIEGCLGPDGCIDTVFHVQHTKLRFAKRIFPKAEFSDKLKKKIKAGSDHRCEIRRGFWYEPPETDGDPRWQYVGMVDDEIVEQSIIKGRGACPLVVGRFNPSLAWFWSAGPMIQALPALREHDELCAAKLDALDLALRPPVAVPDDSYVQFKDGIETGYAYPVRPGGGQDIRPLYPAPNPNIGIYDKQDLETRIKRLFYLDWPEQSGDTPPSATQWLDEMTMAQRRIGTPGLPFWWEFCAPVFQRFEYLLKKRGDIEPVRVDGKIISLVPYNPAQRAAEQQEVAQFARFLEIGGMAFPEEMKMASDGLETLVILASKLGADKIWRQRDPAQVQQAVQLIAQLSGGAVPGAPQVGGPAGAPAPGLDDSGGGPVSPLEPQVRMSI